MAKNDYLSIAIPIFNETNGVLELLQKALGLPLNKEIIIIDDASTSQETKKILIAISKIYPQIKMITNSRNLGKSASIQKALAKARGNLFTILDGDSELDPKDIVFLYRLLKMKDARLANGVRIVRNKKRTSSYSHTITRAAKKIFGALVHFFYGVKIKDVLSGLKLFYVDDFRNYHFSTKRFGLETELIIETLKNRRKMIEGDVSYHPRTYKEGKKINFSDGFEIFQCILTRIKFGADTLRSPFGIITAGAIILFFSLRMYSLSANSSPTSDSIPNNLTALNIIYHGRADIENFRPYLIKRQLIEYVGVENAKGVLYSKTPIINGILAAPYFFIFDKLHNIDNVSADQFFHKDYERYYQAVGKYYASLLVSVSVLIIFLTVWELYRSILYAASAALAYGFTTMVYSTAAQGNWQHGPSLLLISISSYLLVFFLKNRNKSLLIAISALLALASLIRISNLLFFAVIIIVLSSYRDYRSFVKLPTSLFFLLIFFWSLSMSLMGVPGGYNDEIARSLKSFNLLYSLKVLASLLLSPNVGLLIFCPLLFLSLLGIYRLIQAVLKNKKSLENPRTIFLLISVLSFVAILFFNSFWWAWEGGFSYGPRLLTESIPFLIFLGAYFVHSLTTKFTKITTYTIFFLLFFYGLAVHVVGVYAYDTAWQYKYYVGKNRLDMAWYNDPNIIHYHLLTRKIFFNQKIIKDKNGLKIVEKYYLLNLQDLKFKLVRTVVVKL